MIEHLITEIIEKDKKLRIEIDGEYHLFLYTRDLKKKEFKGLVIKDATIDSETLKFFDDYVITRGKRRIYYLLAKQDYPKAKLREKLLKNGYIDKHITLILEPFLENGFINDQALIERRVKQYKSYKSKKEIKYNLMNKGLKGDEVSAFLKDNYSDEDEYTTAAMLLSKKYFLKVHKIEKNELYKKAMGYLSRKGYPYGVCAKAFENFYNDSMNNSN